jgi:uncharacterized Zn finger protein (UPF0148 family)
MTQCIGVKPNGELCRGVAVRGSDYCPAHDPRRKEARKRSASKAAKAKRPAREVSDVKLEVAELIRQVREKEMDRADAIACGQLYNVVLRAVSVGLKVHETQVLEARVEELERLLETREDSEARAKPWG